MDKATRRTPANRRLARSAPLLGRIAARLLTCAVALASGPAMAIDAPALRIAVPVGAPAPKGTEARAFTDEGFARSLARDLAKAMGRRVTLHPLLPDDANRESMDFDLAVGFAPSGRNWIGAGPTRALSVAMRSDTDIHDWVDLRGRTVCFTAGETHAAELAEELGAVPRPQRAPALSLLRVRTGECDAALHEADQLNVLLAQPEWQKFSATLPPRDPLPLGVSVPAADPGLIGQVEEILTAVASPPAWEARHARWARNVAFEVWLEQDAPDCH